MVTSLNLNCRWVRRRLPLLADVGDLPWTDRRRVERHLIGCPSCRVEHRSLDSALLALRTSSRSVPTDPEAPSIWPAVAREIRGTRHARPISWLGLSLGSSLALAAGTLVIGGLVGLSGWPIRSAAAPRAVEASVATVAQPPRPALPEGVPTFGPVVPTDLRLSAELDPRSPLHAASGDPQKSQ